MPENTIYVGRGSKWGNPFSIAQHGRVWAVELYGHYMGHPNSPHKFEPHEITELRGKNLACWCPLDKKCHADYLLKAAALDSGP